MSKFRNEIPAVIKEDERNKLKAELDASVAHLYGLTLEEYQIILETFPLIDKNYKKLCVEEFNELIFSSDF